jgi:hypothetical protein
VPAADFVAVEERRAPLTDAIGLTFRHTADGGWFPNELYDVEAERPCNIATDGPTIGGSEYCVGPAAFSDADGYPGFQDSDCSEPAAAGSTCVEPELITLYQIDEDRCSSFSLLELGDELETLYSGTPDMCEQAEPSSDPRRYYALGEPVQGLIPVGRARGDESGRLQTLYRENDGERVQILRRFWDTELELECSELTLDSGEVVCAPDLAYTRSSDGVNFYADSDCELGLVQTLFNGCPDAPFHHIAFSSELSYCAPTHASVRAITGSYTGSTLYSRDTLGTGDCIEEVLDAEDEWFELSAPLVPGEDLAELSRTTDD